MFYGSGWQLLATVPLFINEIKENLFSQGIQKLKSIVFKKFEAFYINTFIQLVWSKLWKGLHC